MTHYQQTSKCLIKRSIGSTPKQIKGSQTGYDIGKSIWKSKNVSMIRKVELSQCYDLAFPDFFVEIYEEGEVEWLTEDIKEIKNTQASRIGSVEQRITLLEDTIQNLLK